MQNRLTPCRESVIMMCMTTSTENTMTTSTTVCADCEGTGRVVSMQADMWDGTEPCRVCDGTGRNPAPKPERVRIAVDVANDLNMIGDLPTEWDADQAGLTDDELDAAYELVAAERYRRIDAFHGAFVAAAERVAQREGIEIEVVDYHPGDSESTRHPHPDGYRSWEDWLWQEIHDATDWAEHPGMWTDWIVEQVRGAK
jgi:hypothetical protein